MKTEEPRFGNLVQCNSSVSTIREINENMNEPQNPQCVQTSVSGSFNLSDRKLEFKKNINNLLSGIRYEKSRVNYDIHSDNFTMFIYFGKRNESIIDAIFTGNSNYYFGSMTEFEKLEIIKEQKDYLLYSCKRFSKFMIQDLIFNYSKNWEDKVKINTF